MTHETQSSGSKGSREPKAKQAESRHSVQHDVYGTVVGEYVFQAIQKGRPGALAEHKRLVTDEQDFSIESFSNNKDKSNFLNVVCFDKTRVSLTPLLPTDTDFIHASHFTAWKEKLILTQKPTAATALDFWRMLWQYKVQVVASLSGSNEPSSFYWPHAKQRKLKFGGGRLMVRLIDMKSIGSWDAYQLKVRCSKKQATDTETERQIQLLHYHKWPDTTLPKYRSVLDFVNAVRESAVVCSQANQNATKRSGSERTQLSRSNPLADQPPTIIQCPSGVLSAGTLATVIACCRQLDETGTFDPSETTLQLRRHRFGCMEGKAHYAFLYLCVFEYSIRQGMIRKDSAPYRTFVKALERQFI